MAKSTVNHMAEIIRASCLKHIYPDQTEVSLCGLEFIVNTDERVAILGPSGSGKSTLLRHILGLLKPSEGSVRVFGVNPESDYDSIRSKIGFVMQDVDEQLTQPTVYDEIAFSLRNSEIPEREVARIVEEILERAGIKNLKDKAPHFLSGGQKRKVALASALVGNPELLILDEPFQGLDPKSRSEYIDLLQEMTKERNLAVVMTLHEVSIVPLVADSVYLLKEGGAISRKGTPREIFQDFDNLKEYNLEPSTLYTIFSALQKKFPSLILPLTIDEALKEIKKL